MTINIVSSVLINRHFIRWFGLRLADILPLILFDRCLLLPYLQLIPILSSGIIAARLKQIPPDIPLLLLLDLSALLLQLALLFLRDLLLLLLHPPLHQLFLLPNLSLLFLLLPRPVLHLALQLLLVLLLAGFPIRVILVAIPGKVSPLSHKVSRLLWLHR